MRSPAPSRRSPACLRVKNGAGAAIEVEVWALPDAAFGRFVAAVPPPLSIGTLELADGRAVKGFLVEAEAVDGARDISSFGGWRAFVAQEKAARVITSIPRSRSHARRRRASLRRNAPRSASGGRLCRASSRDETKSRRRRDRGHRC